MIDDWVARLSPAVEEDELEVQAGTEHEHVAVEFDLSDATGRQRMTHGHQTHNLIARFVETHLHHILADLQITTAVNHLHTHAKTEQALDYKPQAALLEVYQ